MDGKLAGASDPRALSPVLSAFDVAEPCEPLVDIWNSNLTALRAVDPQLAQSLNDLVLPSTWRPVLGLDGAPTWRLEAEGATLWLADSAAPQSRAAGLLGDYRPGEKNPALTSQGSGAEIAFLLDRLGPLRALFVFLSDLTPAAAILRAYDVSEALSNRRLILVPPDEGRDWLRRLMEAEPGLTPPGELLPLPETPAERTEALHALCAATLDETSKRRTSEMNDRAKAREQSNLPKTPTAWLFSLAGDEALHRVSDDLSEAASAAGWATKTFQVRGPRDIGPAARCTVLGDDRATITVSIGRTAAPRAPVDGLTLHWNTDELSLGNADESRLQLAASPAIARALRDANVPKERVIDFFWACGNTDFVDPRQPSKFVYLIGDVPDDSPKACGIEQTTHKYLWRAAAETIKRGWETALPHDAKRAFEQAERRSGVHIQDEALREQLCRIVRHVLIPAVILRTIHQRLSSRGVEVRALGRGWHDADGALARSAGMCEWPADAEAPCAAIFAGRPDPLCPALLRAAARGWNVALYCGREGDGLGGVLTRREHLRGFSDEKELMDAIRDGAAGKPNMKQTERVREHLWRDHRYQQRWIALAERLRGLLGDRERGPD